VLILSKRIGTGIEGDFYRPEIMDEPDGPSFGWVDLNNGYFLAKIDAPLKNSRSYLELKALNFEDISQKTGVSTAMLAAKDAEEAAREILKNAGQAHENARLKVKALSLI
jgi:hypothetical protein